MQKNKTNHVWVVDDDQSMRWVMKRALIKAKIDVTIFDSAKAVLAALKKNQPHTIVSDIRMPGMDGLTLLKNIQKKYPTLPIIIMTAHSDLDSAVSSYQGGAFEYLPKPFDINEATDLIKRACETYHATIAKEAVGEEEINHLVQKEIIGQSVAMQEVFRAIGRLCHSSITVLITGESGTGKELIAKALHTHSLRADKPFIAINTAAIPKDLLESELFGHDKGAFTGAHALRKGRFEQANHGTLFLDEIGDMPLELQTRLLRVLATGEFYRVGGRMPVKVDVRIITATHQNLKKNVKKGLFREDLYHRLNVIRVHSPALRKRKEDIPLLLNHFMSLSAKELKVEQKTLTPAVIHFLQCLDWVGNVRQLENTCRWLTVMASGQEVIMDDLPIELQQETQVTESDQQSWDKQLANQVQKMLLQGERKILSQLTPIYEKTLLEETLKYTNGKKIKAAKLLGWGRNTLTRKLKELK